MEKINAFFDFFNDKPIFGFFFIILFFGLGAINFIVALAPTRDDAIDPWVNLWHKKTNFLLKIVLFVVTSPFCIFGYILRLMAWVLLFIIAFVKYCMLLLTERGDVNFKETVKHFIG